MAAAARTVLGPAGITAGICELGDSTAAQPGAAFALFADFIGGTRLGADRAGAPHRPAERIGAQVARLLLAEIDSGATIDRHASDQIIPFAALADGTSSFQVPSSPTTPRRPGGGPGCFSVLRSVPQAPPWWSTARVPGACAWTHAGKTTRRRPCSATCARG